MGTPSIDWFRFFGGGGDDLISDILSLDDGYIVSGGREATSGYAWLLRLNPSGQPRWQKTLGSQAIGGISDMTRDDRGNIIVLSWIEGGEGGHWVASLTTDGTVNWSETYSHPNTAGPYSITATTDGGYAFVGLQNRENSFTVPVAYKLTGDGSVVWEKEFWGDAGGEFHSVLQTEDGGYLIGGMVDFDGTLNTAVMKLTQDGTKSWERTYGSRGYGNTQVRQTAGEGWLLTAPMGSPESPRPWLGRLDTTGRIIWDREFDGNGRPEHAVQTDIERYVLATTQYHRDDSWSVKIYWLRAEGATAETAEFERRERFYAKDFVPAIEGDGHVFVGGVRPGEYGGQDGIVFSVSGDPYQTPTPADTPTETTTVPPTVTEEPTTTQRDSQPGTDGTDAGADGEDGDSGDAETTGGAGPGFGVLTGLAGISLGAWQYLRKQDADE